MKQKILYEFINSQTGNAIAYLSLLTDMDEKERHKELEKKRAEQATEHHLNIELIYWQDKARAIK